MENVDFVPFPKPIKSLEKCLKWIKLCGRPHEQLNVSKINAYKYVCTKVRTNIFLNYELNCLFYAVTCQMNF